MIESFVLLCIRDGTELEIDIIGLASMQFPLPETGSSAPSLAKIMVGLVARIMPERGVLAVNGAFLAGSYIYSPLAQISGGFGLLTLFKEQTSGQWAGGQEGDFIITMGGYNPSYAPKSYYPSVPRLEMNWKVSDALWVKADAYFAITPQAMMAGGNMTAHFNAGGSFEILAVFTIGADFIIYWKPFHYLANFYADMAISARIDVDLWLFSIHKSVDFDLSADIKVWGPSFSGYASVKVHVLVSFTVGVSFGEQETVPQPISWDDFKSGFLPDHNKIVNCTLGAGLVANQPSTQSVVNAKELCVVCGTAIPVKSVSGPIAASITSISTAFGIAPMANTTFICSNLAVTISKDNVTLSSTSGFAFEPILKNMPAALWQSTASIQPVASLSTNTLISGLLCGVRITTVPPIAAHIVTVNPAAPDVINLAPPSGVSFFQPFSYDSNISSS